MSEYSSHDWRKNTDDAVVFDSNSATLKVNDCKVKFTNKLGRKYNIELTRLIQVFNNNVWENSKSVK